MLRNAKRRFILVIEADSPTSTAHTSAKLLYTLKGLVRTRHDIHQVNSAYAPIFEEKIIFSPSLAKIR
jgi:hypothetical protein